MNVNVTFGSGEPTQTVPPPLATAVGNGLTMTLTGVPKLVPTHVFASVNAVTEYVPTGALVIVKVVVGWFTTFTGVTPSVYVKVNGAVPMKVNVTFGSGEPAQTDPPPLITAVGNGLTMTLTGAPRLVATQVLASVKAVTWYAPAGALLIVKVVVGWLTTFTGVTPSV